MSDTGYTNKKRDPSFAGVPVSVTAGTLINQLYLYYIIKRSGPSSLIGVCPEARILATRLMLFGSEATRLY
jgi:hypothetical protein